MTEKKTKNTETSIPVSKNLTEDLLNLAERTRQLIEGVERFSCVCVSLERAERIERAQEVFLKSMSKIHIEFNLELKATMEAELKVYAALGIDLSTVPGSD